MDKSNEGRAAMDVKFHFSSKTRHTMVNLNSRHDSFPLEVPH